MNESLITSYKADDGDVGVMEVSPSKVLSEISWAVVGTKMDAKEIRLPVNTDPSFTEEFSILNPKFVRARSDTMEEYFVVVLGGELMLMVEFMMERFAKTKRFMMGDDATALS